MQLGTIDCLIFGDILEHLIAPDEVLRRFKKLLSPQGIILCSVPNVQHQSLVQALLKGDFQYSSEGLLDAGHLRFFTYSTFIKLMLDCGLAPTIVDAIRVPGTPQFEAALDPLIRYLGLDSKRTLHYLEAYQYIFRGVLMHDHDEDSSADLEKKVQPLTFAVCVSDEGTLQANLLSSPCLRSGSPHEVLLMRGCRSAADGLNRAVQQARNSVVVYVHQDVYLPRGWSASFWQQFQLSQDMFGNVGIVGVYGVGFQNGTAKRLGHVISWDRILKDGADFPAKVETLDELLLAVPREIPFKFHSCLGFHFYGADACLAARQHNLTAVVVDDLCYHNTHHVVLKPDFYQSGQAFAAKWSKHLPLATSCVLIDRKARFQIW